MLPSQSWLRPGTGRSHSRSGHTAAGPQGAARSLRPSSPSCRIRTRTPGWAARLPAQGYRTAFSGWYRWHPGRCPTWSTSRTSQSQPRSSPASQSSLASLALRPLVQSLGSASLSRHWAGPGRPRAGPVYPPSRFKGPIHRQAALLFFFRCSSIPVSLQGADDWAS